MIVLYVNETFRTIENETFRTIENSTFRNSALPVEILIEGELKKEMVNLKRNYNQELEITNNNSAFIVVRMDISKHVTRSWEKI